MKEKIFKISLLILCACWLMFVNAKANTGASWEGTEGVVTFTHTASCDSVNVSFGFSGSQADTLNYYETLALDSTTASGGMLWYSDALDLDSIGVHIVKIAYWIGGSASYAMGTWTHQTGSAWVTGASSVGTGSDSVNIYAIDTSGTEATVSDAKITINNASGTTVSVGWTNGAGYKTFYLDPATYTVTGRKTGYGFLSASYIHAADNDSLAWNGYNIAIGSPGSADQCRVYGYLTDGQDSALYGAVIEAKRVSGSYGVDSASVITASFITQEITTDTLGYFFLDLKRTTTFTDTTQGFWNIKGLYGGNEIFNLKRLYIPSADSLNIGDSLGVR